MTSRLKWIFIVLAVLTFLVWGGVLWSSYGAGSGVPTPTVRPTVPSPTPSPSPTRALPTSTFTPEPTSTFTPSPTATPSPTPTATETPTPRPTTASFSLNAPALIAVTPTLSDTTAVPTAVPAVSIPADAINIVVLGSDRRPDWDDWHTDVVQVVSIQPTLPSVTVLSIPRDLYVYIPGFRMSRVNFADMYGELYHYQGGGPALIQQTLLYNLGIPIHHYVRTDFDGFIGIVDAMGGIDIPVHCRLHDYWPYPDENGEFHVKVMEPGMQHMDGQTALWYARSRKTTSVFDRERRQQQVLQAIWRKSRDMDDLLPRLPQLWAQFNNMVVTDMDLTEVAQLAEIGLRLERQNIRFRNIGYQQVTPWTTPYGGSVFLPNWPEIEPVVREALAPVPEGRMWRALHTVEVWNGTYGADWDQLAADRLYRQGFGALVHEPDRRDYAQTQLIDFTGATKGSAIPHLQWMFQVAPENVISAPDSDAGVHYRLILGADYTTCRSP